VCSGAKRITDDVERTSAEAAIDWADARERLTVRRLDSIDRALDAMVLGNYGLCAACGAAIEVERLRLVPETLS
jgi:RNA polymerase-binding transcription factor DksA